MADGLLFITPYSNAPTDPAHAIGHGAEIVDNQGRPVWFKSVEGGYMAATDFRVQSYRGKPVLTWIEGVINNAQPTTPTIDYILDDTYKVVATVQAGNGMDADQHEFLLTPQNTALLAIYHLLPADLSSVGGSANGVVCEGVVQEVDVATGRVLLEWHSLPDIPLTDSYATLATRLNAGYDYFHLNSVSIDTDGNLLVSARHTSTVYKINRTTGALMWKLGGKRSDFALGAGLTFAWQHDAIAVDAKTIRIFDNESNGKPVLPYSRVIWVRRDEATMTATIVRSIKHPEGISSAFMGNAQQLDNGNLLVGWGSAGRSSEFDATGQLLFDAAVPPGYNSYRSYRFPWTGRPADSPTAVAKLNGDGTFTVHAVWNGATEVATWVVLGGRTPDLLSPIGTAKWNGLDTAISVPGQVLFVQVVAYNITGGVLGTSAAAPVIPGTVASIAHTVANGSTAVLTAPASNAVGLTYQWYHGGAPVSGATNQSLVIGYANASAAGTYVLTATNAAGSAIVSATVLNVSTTASVSRLGNFSVLNNSCAECVAGFSVGGAGTSGTATVLARASGPALTQFGGSSVLADPTLTVFRGVEAVAANDNWNIPAANGTLVAAAASAFGAFPFTDLYSLDSALVCSLPANGYTAVVGSNGIAAGLVLLELYDATPADTPYAPRLINLSVRGRFGATASNLATGFSVRGSVSKTVLIRATGPALRAFGIAGGVPDPQLTLHPTGGGRDVVIAGNAGWRGDPQLSNAGNAVGAFALSDPASADSAVLVMLPPGGYTVDVSSASGSTGVALLEIYELP